MAVVVDGVVLAAVGHGDHVDVMDEKVHRDGQATSLGKTRFELGRVAWSSHFLLGRAAAACRFLEPPHLAIFRHLISLSGVGM